MHNEKNWQESQQPEAGPEAAVMEGPSWSAVGLKNHSNWEVSSYLKCLSRNLGNELKSQEKVVNPRSKTL